MKKIKRLGIVVFLVLAFIISCDKGPIRDLNPETLEGGFELLTTEQTGIDFDNSITENKGFHHYLFSQIYLGSGVAIGDLNNDGLPDIFFGGNQVSDRLYINKGNFEFEDITKSSKIAVNPGWTWGVTMVDINSDGFLDIYVSRNGYSFEPKDRRNQLYINNGDLTFTESAISYGLADIGFSTEAVFFDMDNDGDLDMYQVNQPADKKLLINNKITQRDVNSFRDKLYENRGGKYEDVSEKAGISRVPAYGLSVSASDFNNDGFTDLYVANDYVQPDFLYFNNGDGTFSNETHNQLNHITQLSMGTDTGDINNDGLIDLITTDMTPEDHYRSKTNMASMSSEAFWGMVNADAHYQYMTNTLQLNTGMGKFSDIANMAGVARTDWSWASLIVDLDNDGRKDIVVSNGIKKDVDNNDYKNILRNLDKDSTTIDRFYQLSKNAPSEPISNYAFRNVGNMEFKKVTKDWGFDTPGFSNGMAYADLDNDGDLDLVLNNMESKASIYKNKATGNFFKIKLNGPSGNTFGIGAKAIIKSNGSIQVLENYTTRGYFSSVEPNLFFGLGKTTNIDEIRVIWPDGKENVLNDISVNRIIEVDYSSAKAIDVENSKNTIKPYLELVSNDDLGLTFKHSENSFDEYQDEILLPHNISQNGPYMATGDVNGDGLEDIFIGGAAGQSGELYFQKAGGTFTRSVSRPWDIDKESEDLGVQLFDADSDGDLDLFIASGGSEYNIGDPRLGDRLYLNNGNGDFTKSQNSLPRINQSTQSVEVADVDLDGDLDLFVGVRLIKNQYGFPASSYLLINENGKFKKDNFNENVFENIGMVTDAVFSDIDQDGDSDLLVVGEWMEIKIFHNNNGGFKDVSEMYGINNSRGMWWSITAGDVDNDGDDDYIVGNLGKNNKFKATPEHPFKVYANDFDENGTNDIVLAKFYKNDYVPVRGRECTSQQMPYVAEKFEDYNSFASSKLIDILPKNKIEEGVVYQISSFESVILYNEGNGKLSRKPLPNQSQVSPIKSSLIYDINQDGNNDIIITGNHFGVEVETTRYDSGFGSILIGNENGQFEYIPPSRSGFFTPKDTRQVLSLNTENRNFVVVLNNNDQPQVFRN